MTEPLITPAASTTGSGRPRPPAWGRMAAVMAGLSILGQLVGVLVGAQILFTADYATLQEHPNLVQVSNAASGLVAGLLGGLLVRPRARRLLQVAVWAVVALGTFLVISLVGLLLTGPRIELSAYLRAGVVVLAVQVVVAAVLWRLRQRRR